MERSQTRYVLLGVLAIHPNQSGYEIRKTIETSVGFFWGESYGQIYPTLKRLLGEGLISARGAKAKAAKGRQEYSITQAGRDVLKGWLALPYRDDPPRDEFLLKLFFGNDAGPEVAIAHLQKFSEQNRQALKMLEGIEALSKPHGSQFPGYSYWILTLGYGLAHTRAVLAWSETALASLRKQLVLHNNSAEGSLASSNTADLPR
jgi:PadR family transcriptional regulator, regulatory protein AphA